MIWGLLLGLIGSVMLLVGSSAILTETFEIIVVKTKQLRFGVAAVLVALATSLPELAIAFAAVIMNKQELALGGLIGANVANLSLVIGLAVVLGGTISVVGDFMKWELAAAFLMGSAPIALMVDGGLSRLDGFILIVIYLVYARDIVIGRKTKVLIGKGVLQRGIFHKPVLNTRKEIEVVYSRLFLSIVGILVTSYLVVRLGASLASVMKINQGLIGLLIISLGMTVPEILIDIQVIRIRKMTLVLANMLGSVAKNSTLVIGVLAVLNPVVVQSQRYFWASNFFFVVTFGLFWLLVKSKKKLEKWEAVVLIGVYLLFVGIEMLLT